MAREPGVPRRLLVEASLHQWRRHAGHSRADMTGKGPVCSAPPGRFNKEAHNDETVGSRNGRVRDLAGGSGMACKPEERT